jgi:hypothetical protein
VLLDLDVPCAQCGYNLRGLESDGVCPECALGIADSARRHRESGSPSGPSVALSSTAWLASLRDGVTLLLLTAGVEFCVYLSQWWMRDYRGYYTFGSLAGWVVARVAMALGLWKLGTPEGLSDQRRRDLIACVVIRVAGIYSMFMFLFLRAGIASSLERQWTLCVFGLFGGVATFAVYRQIARLLMRMNHPRAAMWARTVAWLLTLLILATEPWRYFGLPFFFGRSALVIASGEPVIGFLPSASYVFSLPGRTFASDWMWWATEMIASGIGLAILILFRRTVARAAAEAAARAIAPTQNESSFTP